MLDLLMEEVGKQRRNSKTVSLEIRGIIDKIIGSLSNLEDNIEWGQTLFEKRFEAMSFQKSSLDGDNFTENISLIVSKEQGKNIDQCSKAWELEAMFGLETLGLVGISLEPIRKM